MTIEKMTEVPYPGLVPWLAVRKKINEIIEEGTGGEVAWGSITGTLADQTDLKNALDGKADTTDLPSAGELVPDTTGVSNGAVLTKVVSGTMWADPLPAVGSASAGDVLTLDSNKIPGWSTPTGGSPTFSVTFKSITVGPGDWRVVYDSDGTTILGYYTQGLTESFTGDVLSVSVDPRSYRPVTLKYGLQFYAWVNAVTNAGYLFLAKETPTDYVTIPLMAVIAS